MASQDHRYNRQSSIVTDKIDSVSATVIGVGAIGRQVAIQLAAIGIPTLTLIDFDSVEDVNLPTQGYYADDLGRYKVDATADICKANNIDVNIVTRPERFTKDTEVGDALFCCVDSIGTRAFIWKHTAGKPKIYIDGRMAAEALEVYTVAQPGHAEIYDDSLFDPKEAYVGSCTAKSTIYCANMAAAVMLSQFTKWLRGMHLHPSIKVNLLAGFMTTE